MRHSGAPARAGESGIHTHSGGGYGFRARRCAAPRNDEAVAPARFTKLPRKRERDPRKTTPLRRISFTFPPISENYIVDLNQLLD
jgi:hypothetical protein